MLAELERVCLLLLYTSDGKKYLQLTQWQERIRSKSKFPAPQTGAANNCAQLPASADNCLPPSSSPSPSITPSPNASTAIAFDAENRRWLGVESKDIAAWSLAYPAVDVQTEMAKAAQWAWSHPANRKSNWGKFLVGWLGRAQDKAPPRASNGGSRNVAL